MKKVKIIAVTLIAALLMASLSTVAFATDGLNAIGQLIGLPDMNDIVEAVGGLLGGNNGNGTTGNIKLSDIFGALTGNQSSILDTIREKLGDKAEGLSDSQLIASIVSSLTGMDLTNFNWGMLTSNSFLDALSKYITGGNVTPTTTTEPATEATTVPVTEAPTTEAPREESTTKKPTYNGSSNYVAPATTVPEEPTTYQYIPPETVSTEALTESTFSPIVYDDNNDTSGNVTVKMVIGIVILVLSGVAVVGVAFVLKKSKV